MKLFGCFVAQVCNLLYRRIVSGRRQAFVESLEISKFCGLQTRDTAGCKPALRFALAWLLIIPPLSAAPAQKPSDEIPPLAPPLPEIPLTFWEQYGWTLWILVPLLLSLVAVVAAVWIRPRKPPVLSKPADQARTGLVALLACPEDSPTLSLISQTLRRYLVATFWLHTGETTTSEFCAALAANAQVGPELSVALGEFLKQCDERKFSPAVSPPLLGAAGRALSLVDQAETRRATLREQAQVPKPA